MKALPKDMIAAIQAAKWKGASLTDLEASFDIGRSTAVRYTKDIPVKARAGREVQFDHDKVLKLLEQGFPQSIIRERLGISRAQVFRICKRYRGCTPSELQARIEWKAAA